jgi:hypothetical protein
LNVPLPGTGELGRGHRELERSDVAGLDAAPGDLGQAFGELQQPHFGLELYARHDRLVVGEVHCAMDLPARRLELRLTAIAEGGGGEHPQAALTPNLDRLHERDQEVVVGASALGNTRPSADLHRQRIAQETLRAGARGHALLETRTRRDEKWRMHIGVRENGLERDARLGDC